MPSSESMSEVWFDGYVHTCRRFGSGYEIVHGTVLCVKEWGGGIVWNWVLSMYMVFGIE